MAVARRRRITSCVCTAMGGLMWSIGVVACGGDSNAPVAEPVATSADTMPGSDVSAAATSPTSATLAASSTTVASIGTALPSPGSSNPTSTPTWSTPAVTDNSMLDDMLLHLPDAPEGARVGDDSSCGYGFSSEGGSDAFLDLVASTGYTAVGCFIQLEAPTVFIDSLVVAFPDDETAARAIEPAVFEGIARYHGLACCSGEELGEFVPTSIDGRAGVEAVGATDSTALVGWQFQRWVGVVAVQHVDGTPGARTVADALAAVQQARTESPVAVPDDIDDDRLAGLRSAPFETWWLGETFTTPGLPDMRLVATNHSDGLATVDYAGIRIEIFDTTALTPGLEAAQVLGVAEALFDSPCSVNEPIESPLGAAQLVGRHVPAEFFGPGQMRDGWGSLNDDECPVGEPNVWMATIDIDGRVLVRVNAPICYNCLHPPDPDFPFGEPDALRAVIAAIRPFDG